MKVSKFGGSSLANATQIKKTCDIICSDSDRKIIVVSAPGKDAVSDIKITDQLMRCADTYISGGDWESVLAEVSGRYAKIADELGIPEIVPQLRDAFRMPFNSGLPDYKLMDAAKALGEDNSAKLVSAYLRKLGYDAKYVNPGDAGMYLSSDYGNAVVLDESYDKLSALRGQPGIIIFPGYFGYTRDGEVVTFPRGGSDITGAIVAAAVKADMYENFTDVDYVYSVNPRNIKNPRPIYRLSYQEMRELSYAGFNVYQEEALLPLYKASIPVNIRNTNNPSCEGTLIAARNDNPDTPVTGIASDKNFVSINIGKYLMNREIGFVRKTLSILESEGISVEHIPSGIDSISIILKSTGLDDTRLERIKTLINDTLSPDSLEIESGLSLIAVVGERMSNNVGIAARAASVFAGHGINIKMINQGASEVSMLFVIETKDQDTAVAELYKEFFV